MGRGREGIDIPVPILIEDINPYFRLIPIRKLRVFHRDNNREGRGGD